MVFSPCLTAICRLISVLLFCKSVGVVFQSDSARMNSVTVYNKVGDARLKFLFRPLRGGKRAWFEHLFTLKDTTNGSI